MTQYGTIHSYDAAKGSGTISPEQGGDALTFEKSALQQEAAEPAQGQRFSYETQEEDGGRQSAINLHQQEQDAGDLVENEKRNQARQQAG